MGVCGHGIEKTSLRLQLPGPTSILLPVRTPGKAQRVYMVCPKPGTLWTSAVRETSDFCHLRVPSQVLEHGAIPSHFTKTEEQDF